MPKQWAAKEVDSLRALHAAGDPTKRIAKVMGLRPYQAIAAVERYCPRKYRRRGNEVRDAISSVQKTDSEIARELGVSRATVYRQRQKMGQKPTKPHGSRIHAKRASQVRIERDRAACERDGWPLGCTSGVAAVLEAIEAGESTAAAVAARLGITDRSVRKHLRDAERSGWVVRSRAAWATWSLTQQVIDRRNRDVPGLVVCFACNAIAPARTDAERLAKYGWHGRTVKSSAGPIFEVLCGLCFSVHGWSA